MAWNVEIEEVLKRWIGEAPDEDDAVLETLITDAVVLIDLKVKNIDARLNPPLPSEPESNLQTLLNMIVSTMVQRAYNSDYSTYTNESMTTGPFSQSYSKAADTKQGLYLLNEELELLRKNESSEPSRISVIRNPARPNFYARGYAYGYGLGEEHDCW